MSLGMSQRGNLYSIASGQLDWLDWSPFPTYDPWLQVQHQNEAELKLVASYFGIELWKMLFRQPKDASRSIVWACGRLKD